MNREERQKLNDERLQLENIIHAYSALHHASQGDCILDIQERDHYLDLIRGQSMGTVAARYVEIQNLQWQDFTGRPVPGGEPHISIPN